MTFLFSLFGSYQRRERRVVTLQAAAGAPPSAVALLETYALLGLVDDLPRLFQEWEDWAVEVLDSHIAYPLLAFFRSSHDNLSWISALGTVLDAASLVLTTIDGPPRGQAKLFKRVGTHLVEDIYYLGFQTGDPVALDRSDFEAACYRLQEAGYTLEPQDEAWRGLRGRSGDVRAAARGHGPLSGDACDAMARRPGGASAAAPSGAGSLTGGAAAGRIST